MGWKLQHRRGIQFQNQTCLIQYIKHLTPKLTNLFVTNCKSCSLHQHNHSKIFWSECVGHLLNPASSQNKHMYCTRAVVPASVHSFLPEAFVGMFPSWNRLLLEHPSVDRFLFSDLPGVLPSTTMGLLAAIIGLKHQ